MQGLLGERACYGLGSTMERGLRIGDSQRSSDAVGILAYSAFGICDVEPHPTAKVFREMSHPEGSPYKSHEDGSCRKLSRY